MIKQIETWRDDWDDPALKEEINAIIIYPLQSFEDWLKMEIQRHGINSEYQAMYTLEEVLSRFRQETIQNKL